MPSLQTLLFDMIILGIFGVAVYAFLIQPRRREFRKRVEYVSTVKPGTQVTTYGGIIGKVKSIDYKMGTARVEIAEACPPGKAPHPFERRSLAAGCCALAWPGPSPGRDRRRGP